MLGLDLDSWNSVMLLALGAAAIAATVVGISTYCVIQLQKQESIDASLEMARIKKDSDEAHKKTIEAQLQLEQLKRQVGPRHLNRETFLGALIGEVTGQVEVLYSRDDAEAMELAQQIALALEETGWKVLHRDPIPDNKENLPSAMGVSGQPKGVTVAAHSISEKESEASLMRMSGKDWVKTPYTVLSHALEVGLGGVSGWASGPNAPVAGTLRIIVAPRI